MANLVEKVSAFLRPLDLKGQTLVIAVSGGPDSIALTRVLCHLRAELGLESLVIGHLNHQIRGAESVRDMDFVKEFTLQLQQCDPAIRLETDQMDVPEEARRRKESLETTARNVRYEWLTNIATMHQAQWIATGHSADDQAETLLHRLIRGTGIRGLRGIPAERNLVQGLKVIRPLLGITRNEILEYLKDIGQTFREDSSNRDFRFTRNRIRGELLPLLKENYNPEIVSTLCRLAFQADDIVQEQEQQIRVMIQQVELPQAGRLLIFDRSKLKDYSRWMIREMFYTVWEREQFSLGEMGFKEWDRIAGVCLDEITAVDLPGAVRVRAIGNVVQVEKMEVNSGGPGS